MDSMSQEKIIFSDVGNEDSVDDNSKWTSVEIIFKVGSPFTTHKQFIKVIFK